MTEVFTESSARSELGIPACQPLTPAEVEPLKAEVRTAGETRKDRDDDVSWNPALLGAVVFAAEGILGLALQSGPVIVQGFGCAVAFLVWGLGIERRFGR